MSSFGHANFVINGKYSKKHYDNLNYYASLVTQKKGEMISGVEIPNIVNTNSTRLFAIFKEQKEE
jgi:hypothetical protein